ncbi:MAG TPA: fimbria/pilus outer membrane usher protein, partial [Anaeromyxobacter sp.]
GDASGFVNYSAQLRTDRRASGFAEAGASQGGRLLYSSGQILTDGTAVRGLSSLTLDDVGALRRLVLGDSFASSTALGGGVLLGGISLAREYGLDPYFIRFPMPRLAGFASTPSTLDVYVNGVLARQVPLAPGGYDISNLPVTTGAGNVQTVLRDAFGRTEVLNWRYYYTAGLLGRGLSDYGYSIGFRRLDYGRTSFDYGRPVLLARHRVGASDALTLGGRLDAAPDLVSGGPSATVGLPFGTLDLEGAASAQAGTLGGAASVAYSFVSRRLGGGALVRLLSGGYASAALRASDDRARVQASAFAGAPVGSRVNLGLSYALLHHRDGPLSDVLSARADLLVATNLTLGVTGSRTRNPGAAAQYDVFATLSFAFAPMSVADVSVQGGASGSAVSAGVQKGLPVGTGYGYRARDGSGPTGQGATGLLQYQWDHGRYEVEYDRAGGVEVGTATVAGGAVFVGERLFLSRPVQDGFGLIRVGVPGIRGFAEGQEVGRTDARGDLLVPSLLPYYGNRLAIADRDVPIEYRIGPTELVAAPTWRGGVVSRFAVVPLRAVEGELVTVVQDADVPPAYGELTLRTPGGPFTSPVGGDGRFYLEAVPPGRHPAEVAWSGGRCRATLIVPESPPIVDLLTVRCLPEGRPPVLVERSVPPARLEEKAVEALRPEPSAHGSDGAAPASVAAIAPEPTAAGTPGAPSPAAPGGGGPEAGTATEIPGRPPAAPAAKPAPPPRRSGFGPHTRRCPSCVVCFLAAIDRAMAARYTLSCVRDLEFVEPGFTRTQAARACLAVPDYEELCSVCKGVRSARRCPSWR